MSDQARNPADLPGRALNRRGFLALGATSAAVLGAGLSLGGLGGGTAQAADLLWAADFSSADDSDAAGFGNVQRQEGGGDIVNGGPPIPVVDHPKLGRALQLTLEENGERLEAAPGKGGNLGEGQEFFFRADFALDKDFPVAQGDPFCLVNQIHHGGNSGSPPIEFDISKNTLSVRGDSDAYSKPLGQVQVDTVYSLVYRVRFSTSPSKSLLEVWLNGKQVLAGFKPPCATMIDGNSYWKGATMYCRPSIPPLTVFQNAHRIGTTYAAVTG